MDPRQYLLSTKAFMYYAVLLAFLVGFFAGRWLGIAAAALLFLFELAYLIVSRHYACFKCIAGVIGGLLLLLLLLGVIPLVFVWLTFLVIAVDIFLHAV